MELLDLTQPLSPATPRSLDHPEVQFPVVRWFSRHGVNTRQIHASLHAGTHIDAPSLYQPGGMTIDQIPLERLCGTAVAVDMTGAPWSAIDAGRLANAAPAIEHGDIVVLWTGASRVYHDETAYVLKAPGLDRSGIDWLVDRGVKAVCSDSPSPEHIFMRARRWKELRKDVFDGVDIDLEQFPPSYGHKTFMANGIFMIESLSGAVERLVGTRFTLMALPAKYQGVEAAPARVVAITQYP